MSADPRQSSLQRRSAARTAVVWDALREVLDGRGAAGPASVVDIGGGTGGFAVRVAELGHRVLVVDPSPDALATLARRADESGVADRVTGRQGDLDSLADLVADADVVLRPGGILSLLVAQRHAAVVTRAMAGHFGQALSMLDEPSAGSPGGGPGGGAGGHYRRFTAGEVAAVLDGTGFDTRSTHAVRVFVDLVPGSLVDLEPGAAQALVELERAVADRPEYLALATQIHTLATRR